MSRVDQYDLNVSLDGQDLGIWDKMTGGHIDSEETKYKPGAMQPQISLGGSQTVTNLVLERLYKLDRDLPLIPTLKARVGRGSVVVNKQSLDVDGNPYGTPTTYQGKLKMVRPPEPDSEGRAAAMIQMEVSTAGIITA